MRSILFGVLLLAGCASSGPKYSDYQSKVEPVKTDNSRVFFYRESRFMASAADAVISINENKVGECGDGKYFFADIPAGKVKIKATMKASPGTHIAETTLEAGNSYYYEVQVNEAYIHSGVILGVIGQSAYVASNKNSAAWVLVQKPQEGAEAKIKDKIYSIDGE